MTAGRRPSEIMHDAEVAMEVALALKSVADRLAERSAAIREAVVADLQAANLMGVLPTLETMPEVGDAVALARAAEELRAILNEHPCGMMVHHAEADVRADEEVDEPDVQGQQEFFGVSVPLRHYAVARDIIRQAEQQVADGIPGDGPYTTFRGRLFWKHKLYLCVLQKERETSLRSGQALNRTSVLEPDVLPVPMLRSHAARTSEQSRQPFPDQEPVKRPSLEEKSAQAAAAGHLFPLDPIEPVRAEALGAIPKRMVRKAQTVITPPDEGEDDGSAYDRSRLFHQVK